MEILIILLRAAGIHGDSYGRTGIGETPQCEIGVQRLRTPHPEATPL